MKPPVRGYRTERYGKNHCMKVLGIGQCSLDMLATVDPYPAADEKAELLSWDEQGGGPAATAIATLARLGVPCAFSGVVGGDREGAAIRRAFASAVAALKCMKIGGRAGIPTTDRALRLMARGSGGRLPS